MNIYVIRNNHRFGPYDEKTLLSYVNNGQVLNKTRLLPMVIALNGRLAFI